MKRLAVIHVVLFLFTLVLGCLRTEAKEAPRVSAQNIVELRKHVGSEITVYGFVERATKSKSGHQFLNFSASEVSVVCFSEHSKKFKSGQPVDLYKNKQIEIKGKLELYKNKLQIKLTDPKMIQVAKKSDPKTSVDPNFKLKQLDSETWQSPAGLRYKGRDPQGLTRVEHVMRHAKDDPKRAGPHGVFDGGKDQNKVFATIDEAWKLIEKKKLRPKREQGREAYTVSMGRRVGYLGGRTGKSRRNPPLNRIFIVVRADSKEVVTAFPK